LTNHGAGAISKLLVQTHPALAVLRIGYLIEAYLTVLRWLGIPRVGKRKGVQSEELALQQTRPGRLRLPIPSPEMPETLV
jgi:hypothetical protein